MFCNLALFQRYIPSFAKKVVAIFFSDGVTWSTKIALKHHRFTKTIKTRLICIHKRPPKGMTFFYFRKITAVEKKILLKISLFG